MWATLQRTSAAKQTLERTIKDFSILTTEQSYPYENDGHGFFYLSVLEGREVARTCTYLMT